MGPGPLKGLIDLFGPWAKWVVIGYGVGIVSVLVGALFVRLRERRRKRNQTDPAKKQPR
jgi:hypothetical protein